MSNFNKEILSIRIKGVSAFFASVALNYTTISFSYPEEISSILAKSLSGLGVGAAFLLASASLINIAMLSSEQVKDCSELEKKASRFASIISLNSNRYIKVVTDPSNTLTASTDGSKITLYPDFFRFNDKEQDVVLAHEVTHIFEHDTLKAQFMSISAYVPAVLASFLGATCVMKYNLDVTSIIPEATILSVNMLMQAGVVKFSSRCSEAKAILGSVFATKDKETGLNFYNRVLRPDRGIFLHLCDDNLSSGRASQLIIKAFS